MKRITQSILLLAIGLGTIALVANGTYKNYLRPHMGAILLIAGSILAMLGLSLLLSSVRHGRPRKLQHKVATDDGGGHDHAGPASAWLLLVPFVVIALITPASLGSFAAARGSQQSTFDGRPETVNPESVARDESGEFTPLAAPRAGAVDLTLLDFNERANWDSAGSLNDTRVRLTGFVTPAPAGTEADFYLTRFVITCCAADGSPIHVAVADFPDDSLPADTWIEIEGKLRESQTPPDPVSPTPATITVDDYKTVEPPAEPYEY